MTPREKITAYIKGKQEVTIPELQQALSADYLTVANVVRGLVAEGLLRFDSGVKYCVVSQDARPDASKADKSADDRFLSDLVGDEIDEEDDPEDDPEEETDEEEFAEDESEEDGEDDEPPPEVYILAQKLEAGTYIEEAGKNYYLVAQGLQIDGETIRFKILVRDEETYLTDNALALLSLAKRVSLSEEEIDERIGFIADRYAIDVVGDELRIKVGSLGDAMAYMMKLFAAMERIMNIDENEVAVCVEYGKEESKIWDAAKEFLSADPGMERGELVLRMRERYQSVKDGDNIDDVIIYARAVKEFSRMSDKDYAESRKILLGRGAHDAGGAEEEKGKEKDVPVGAGGANEPALKIVPTTDAGRAADIIADTLAGFRIDTEITDIAVGTTVMRIKFRIPNNISQSSVLRRDEELAMRLGQKEGVRVYFESESGRICVEVPRAVSERETVKVSELNYDDNERRGRTGTLFFAVGKNMDGRSVFGDISRLNHTLIGGTNRSGKSTLLHTMIFSFITRYSPEEVRLILCDAKKTEFARYRGMPHLLTGQIVTQAKQMIRALCWANKEMERRYQLFAAKTAAGEVVRNIDEYNASCKDDEAKLPRIGIIADDYTDFIMKEKRNFEEIVYRLVQKARAAGIFLVFATRDLSAQVVTDLLKTNFPTRIAFRVAKAADSYTILNECGAEKLLGAGDMLMRSQFDYRCERIQGAYVPQGVLTAAVTAIKKKYEARFDEQAKKYIK